MANLPILIERIDYDGVDHTLQITVGADSPGGPFSTGFTISYDHTGTPAQINDEVRAAVVARLNTDYSTSFAAGDVILCGGFVD